MTIAELLGDTEPLTTTTPIEDREDDGMEHQAPHGRWITALVLLAVLAGLAVVVLGIALGGPWRWVAGAAVVAGIAAIIVPGVVDGKAADDSEDRR